MNAPDPDIFQFQLPTLNGCNGNNSLRDFFILYHGSLVRRNGFDLAVDALAVLANRIPTAKLVVCGERNEFFEEVMQSAHDRRIDGQIEYLGTMNHEQISDTIRRCDIGIVPNQRNSFTDINMPTRIFEYLALGKPVVAPRTLGIQDYFADNEILYFEVGDSAALARQIEFAYLNREEMRKVVERGQQVYLANRWELQRKSLLDAFCGLFPDGVRDRN
jgi:glycosyltransferase involved in cell wall biosynthesis